jgi:hypothetical protein
MKVVNGRWDCDSRLVSMLVSIKKDPEKEIKRSKIDKKNNYVFLTKNEKIKNIEVIDYEIIKTKTLWRRLLQL